MNILQISEFLNIPTQKVKKLIDSKELKLLPNGYKGKTKVYKKKQILEYAYENLKGRSRESIDNEYNEIVNSDFNIDKLYSLDFIRLLAQRIPVLLNEFAYDQGIEKKDLEIILTLYTLETFTKNDLDEAQLNCKNLIKNKYITTFSENYRLSRKAIFLAQQFMDFVAFNTKPPRSSRYARRI